MLLSSHETKRWPGFVGAAVTQDGVENVDFAPGQCDQGLVVSSASGSVRSARDALPASLLVGFPGPPPE